MAWGVDYRALWDNDKEGRTKCSDATEHFGEREAEKRFRLLPLSGKKKKRRLEDLFVDEELASLAKRVGIPQNSKFEKYCLRLFTLKTVRTS